MASKGASGTAAAYQQSTFARAIASFLSDIRRKEDIKSPFYKEVLHQLSALALHDGAAQQSQTCAQELSAFIASLERVKTRESKTVRIAEKLRPFVTGLSQYTKTLDIVIQAAPAAALVLYGGARLVLQLAQSFYNCFDTILDVLAEIGHLLRCYELFSSAYHSSADIQDLLVESYKNIVGFWQKAAHILSRKAYKTLLTGLIKPLDVEWQKCRQGLDRDCNRVRGLAQATEAELQRQRELKHAETQQGECRRQLVEWLKGGEHELDVRVDLRLNLDLHQTGTCKWLYDNQIFQDWYNSRSNVAVWYHAGPGAGKTVLSSSLIEHLQSRGFAVAYFFFSFNDTQRRKSITALRSLALQLLTLSDTIPDRVLSLYKADLSNHVYALRDHRTAALVVKAFLKQSSRVHIILDGLDECFDSPVMRNILTDVVSSKTYGLTKWFYTSRFEPEIRSMSQTVGAEEIVPSTQVITSDIKTYLEAYMVRADLDECCVDHWSEASEGNFLWIHLTLDILMGVELTCDEDIDEELKKFPSGLTGCYLRTLHQLSLRSKPQQELARRIFTILVVAEQPLHLSELSNALGIRDKAEDYSSKRIPKRSLIEDLCSHLVTFDCSSRGNEKDPLLKLAHKSVQDFFTQDAESLDVPDGLRQFFVNMEAANLEVGSACLTYLSYARYQERVQQQVQILENDAEGEHAFLKYAAAFWFRHLMRTSHSSSLFDSVDKFIRSPAFWTCLAVQCKTTPHLVAPILQLTDEIYSLGVSGSGSCAFDQNLHFALPLPDWVEEYPPDGPGMIQEFLAFIMEWHSVLISYPDAMSQCVLEILNTNPGLIHNTAEFKGLRVVHLISEDSITRSNSNFYLHSLDLREGDLNTLTIEQQPQRLLLRRSLIEPQKVSVKEVTQIQMPKSVSTCNYSNIHFEGDTRGISGWWLDLDRLDLTWHNGSDRKTFQSIFPTETARGSSDDNQTSQWDIVLTSKTCNEFGNVCGYHCSRAATGGKGDADSGYVSDSDSDSDCSSGSEPDDDLDKTPIGSNNRCIVIACDNSSPIWFSWCSGDRPKLQVGYAVHPSKPLVVWSHAAHEYRLADLTSGCVESGILPEPVDIKLDAATVLHKELQFSSDGKVLYYFLCSIIDGSAEVTCSLSVSSFTFINCTNNLEGLRRSHPCQRITYQTSKSIKNLVPPYILSQWTAEYFYVALPMLSSKPKVVRFMLRPLDDAPIIPSCAIQTLQSPIYFPSTTPYRNPKLFIYSKTSSRDISKRDEYLVLALDPTPTTDQRVLNSTRSPILMRWTISKTNGWRDWASETDACALELKADLDTYCSLRGSFVDSEQRFQIPIRSGLDWKKKAFLSCA